MRPARSWSAPPAARGSLGSPLAVAGLAAVGCAAVWCCDPTTPGGLLPVCPTRALLGIDCPGCGTLRAVYSLLHLDLGGALRYNALGVVALAGRVWAVAGGPEPGLTVSGVVESLRLP